MASKLSDRVARSMMLRLYPAQVLAILVPSLNALFSSLLIGNFMGSEYIAVFGFIAPLKRIQIMLGGGIAAGSQILCGRYMGSGEPEKIGETYGVVSMLCFGIGAVMTLIFQCFPMQIASVLGASGSAQILVTDYLRGYSWSMVLMLFSSSMIPFLQLNNASNVMSASVFVMTAVNLGGNLLNIFVLKLGMLGCGYASSASYLASVLVVVIYYFSDKCTIRLRFGAFRWSRIKEIFTLGAPYLIRPFCNAVRDLTLNNIAVRISGTMAITALAIIGNVAGIIGAVSEGLPGAVNMSASIFYGERDKKSLREVAPIGLRCGLFFGATPYLLVLILANPIARVFGAEAEIVPFVANAMRIYMFYLISALPYDITASVYNGIGQTKLTSFCTVNTALIAPVLAGLILPPLFGINGVWIASIIGEPATFILTQFYAAKKLGHFPRKLTEIVYIPETFGTSDENRCNAVIRSSTDATAVSQRVIDFCHARALDERTAHYCGLCIEEMSMAILEHGLEQMKGRIRGREIDVRIICEDNGLTMLLRDNYPNFNPEEWARLCEPDDPMRSVGIRAVKKLAKSIEYSTTLNLNLISIRVED